MATIRDICTDALLELGVLAGSEQMSATDATFVKNKLQRLLNNWNADRRAVYAARFDTFVLTPSLSPHTIGPTGATWTMTQRPVTILGANLILTTSTPNTQLPINLRDAAWWDAQTVPSLTSDVPTDLYYQPDWPNGKLYFWPVPTAAYSVELQSRVLLDDTLALSDTFTLPPGYQDAVTLSLAEACALPFGVDLSVSGAIAIQARLARSRIFSNNETPIHIRTDDGLGDDPRTRPTFNYLIGS